MPHKVQSRSRILSDAELKRVWDAYEKLEKKENGPDPLPSVPAAFPAIVKLLILTGQRRGGIAALKTSFIDLDKKAITLPAKYEEGRCISAQNYGGVIPCSEDDKRFVPGQGWVSNSIQPHE